MNFESNFADRINAYLDYRVALGYSRKTDAYILLGFDNYCLSNYPSVNEVTRELVHDWLNSVNTVLANKYTAIRNFAKYLYAQGADAYVIPERYTPVQSPTNFKPYLFNDSEIKALFQAISQIQGYRKQPHLHVILPALFRLIYTCGLRPNEGRELLRENVNLKTGEVTIVNTKGKKDRIVVMSDDMRTLCAEYDKRRETFAGANPYFFPSNDGGVFTARGLIGYFRKSWTAANPNVPATELPSVRIYDLRHLFATTAMTRWIENGANLQAKLAYLRAYMGHATLDETMYYVHLLPETLLSGGKWDINLEPEVQSW